MSRTTELSLGGIVAAILILAVLIFGWTALVLWIYNAVAVSLGWPTLTYWVMFGLMFLLGVIGRAFHSPKVSS